MSVSNLEASKNANIQARFDTKVSGTKSRLYRVTLKDGVVANVIFNDSESIEEATECMRRHYGERLVHVK